MEHPFCCGGHGDPLAKKLRAQLEPLAVELPLLKGHGGQAHPGRGRPRDGVLQVRPLRSLPIKVQVLSLCVLCKEEGHASSNYPSLCRKLNLQIMGSAIPSEGFFCMKFKDDEEVDVFLDLEIANAAILSANPRKLNIRTPKQELKHMVAGEWDWQISQVCDNNFSVGFPLADLLHMANNSGKLFMSINDIMARVWHIVHEEI